MTEPLIDRDGLFDVIDATMEGQLRTNKQASDAIAGTVLTYLREVLTPEALTTDLFDPINGYYQYLPGTNLRRRIFGEDS